MPGLAAREPPRRRRRQRRGAQPRRPEGRGGVCLRLALTASPSSRRASLDETRLSSVKVAAALHTLRPQRPRTVVAATDPPLDPAAETAHDPSAWSELPTLLVGRDRVTAGTAMALVLVAPDPGQPVELGVGTAMDRPPRDLRRDLTHRRTSRHPGQECHDVGPLQRLSKVDNFVDDRLHQNGQPEFSPRSSSGIARSVASLSPPNSWRFGCPDAYAVVRYPPRLKP